MKKKLWFSFLFALVAAAANGQGEVSLVPYFTYGKGLSITSADSLLQLNIRFRMQNRVAITTESIDNLEISEVEARVRRLRLRFDGFIYTPKLTYVIQLAFSRGDLDFEDTGFPNIIRDAMVIYNFNEHFGLGMGQTKLPGNRQRLNSSGDLQLPDRSIVNSRFNIDRDFGLQGYFNHHVHGFHYVIRGAISTGEGRNFNSTDRGLAYTGRVELLPLGVFTGGGDYFEGDLVREEHPKISFGLTYSTNQNATRTGGQLGQFLYSTTDINTGMMDFLAKYNGWAFAAEYLNRTSPTPITQNEEGDIRYVFAGHGLNLQGSYIFPSDFEVVARFSEVDPARSIQDFEPRELQYTIGLTKYLRGHRVKIQTDFTVGQRLGTEPSVLPDSDYLQWRFQIEAGI